MSGENVALVRSIIDAWNEGMQVLIDAYTDDTEWDFRGWDYAVEGTFRGTQGLEQMVGVVKEAWEEIRVDPAEYLDAGDNVVFFGRFYARRRGGDLEVSDAGTCVFEVQDGKVSRFALFRKWDEAFESLGRPAPPPPATQQ
jgi:ketosteroid isomerase-like protein